MADPEGRRVSSPLLDLIEEPGASGVRGMAAGVGRRPRPPSEECAAVLSRRRSLEPRRTRMKHDVWRTGPIHSRRARANPRRAAALRSAGCARGAATTRLISEPAFAGQAGCLQHVVGQQGIDGGDNALVKR